METWPFTVLLMVMSCVSQTHSTIVTGQQIVGRNVSFGTMETGLLQVNPYGNGGGSLYQDPTASIIVHPGSHVILNGVFVQGPGAKFEYRGTYFELSSPASVIQKASSTFVLNTTKLSYDDEAYVELGEMSWLEIGDYTCWLNNVCGFESRVVLGFNSTAKFAGPYMFFDNVNYGCTVNIGANVKILATQLQSFIWLFGLRTEEGVANIGDNAFFNISSEFSRFEAPYSNLTVPAGFRLTLENRSGLKIEEGFSLNSLPQNLVINSSMWYDIYELSSYTGLFSIEGNVNMILQAGNSFNAAEGAKITSLHSAWFMPFISVSVNTSGEISMGSRSQIYITYCLTIMQGGSLRMSEDSLFNISHTGYPLGLSVSGSVQLGNGSRLYTNGSGCIAGTIEVYGTGYANFSAPFDYFSLPGHIFVQDGGSLVAHPSTDSLDASKCIGTPAPNSFVLSANASLTISNYAKFEHPVGALFSLGAGSHLTIGSRLNFTMEPGSGVIIGVNMNCRSINHVVLHTGTYINVEPNYYPSEYFICF